MVPIADMRSFRIFRQLLSPDSYLRRATATNLIATHARIYWAAGIFYAFFAMGKVLAVHSRRLTSRMQEINQLAKLNQLG
jgi:hypothetical protein